MLCRYFKRFTVVRGHLHVSVGMTFDTPVFHVWKMNDMGYMEYCVPCRRKVYLNSLLEDLNRYHPSMRQRDVEINGVQYTVYYPNRTQRKHGVKYLG